jgi:hypothetical protein
MSQLFKVSERLLPEYQLLHLLLHEFSLDERRRIAPARSFYRAL